MSHGVVETFLGAMAPHDWEAMGACVADDIVRVGPYGDTYEGREAYVAFISALLPTLPGYHMEVHRVVYSGDGRVATAELSETIDIDGAPHRTPEVLVFDLDDAHRITHIAIYLRQPGPPPTPPA